ncbi:hypothetical protein CSUI_000583 [Cystoisospora suis]|uniref:Uncharacterized protein n=1 Tax=Cystoisospora suis TaxID=483139 RepID=A0A2C6LFY8_9APIC|nr:hypothetical protein CSUI_000583 [Cystoisospora suis]
MAAKLLPSRSSSFSSSRPSVLPPSGRQAALSGPGGVPGDPSTVVSSLLTLPESSSLIEQLFISRSNGSSDSSSGGPGTIVYVQQALNHLTVQQASRSEELRNLIGMRYLSFLHSAEHVRSMVEASTDLHSHVSRVCNFVSELSHETDSEQDEEFEGERRQRRTTQSTRQYDTRKRNGSEDTCGYRKYRGGNQTEGEKDGDTGVCINGSFMEKCTSSDQRYQGEAISLLDSTPLDSWLDDSSFSGNAFSPSNYSSSFSAKTNRRELPSLFKPTRNDLRCTYTSAAPTDSSTPYGVEKPGRPHHVLLTQLNESALRDLLLRGIQEQMILSSRFWRSIRDSSFLSAFRLLCIEAPSQQRDLSMLSDALQKKKRKICKSDLSSSSSSLPACSSSSSSSSSTKSLPDEKAEKKVGDVLESSLIRDCQAILQQKREELRYLLPLLCTYSLQSLSGRLLSSAFIPIHACAALLLLDRGIELSRESLKFVENEDREIEVSSLPRNRGDHTNHNNPNKMSSTMVDSGVYTPEKDHKSFITPSTSFLPFMDPSLGEEKFLVEKLFSLVSIFFSSRCEALRRCLPAHSYQGREEQKTHESPQTPPASHRETSFLCTQCQEMLKLLAEPTAKREVFSLGETLSRETKTSHRTQGSSSDLRGERRLLIDSQKQDGEHRIKGVQTPESSADDSGCCSALSSSSSLCLCCILHDLLFAFESSIVAAGILFLSSPCLSCLPFLTPQSSQSERKSSFLHQDEPHTTSPCYSSSHIFASSSSSSSSSSGSPSGSPSSTRDHFLMLEIARHSLVSLPVSPLKKSHRGSSVNPSRPTKPTEEKLSCVSSSLEETDRLHEKLAEKYAHRISFYMSIFPQMDMKGGGEDLSSLFQQKRDTSLITSSSPLSGQLRTEVSSAIENLSMGQEREEDSGVLSKIRRSFFAFLQAHFCRFWFYWEKEILLRVRALLRDAKESGLIHRSIHVKCIWHLVLQRLEESRNSFFLSPSSSSQGRHLTGVFLKTFPEERLGERREGGMTGRGTLLRKSHADLLLSVEPSSTSINVWRYTWYHTLRRLLHFSFFTDQTSSLQPIQTDQSGQEKNILTFSSSSFLSDSSSSSSASDASAVKEREDKEKNIVETRKDERQEGEGDRRWTHSMMIGVREVCRDLSKELLKEQIHRRLSFIWMAKEERSVWKDSQQDISSTARGSRRPSFTDFSFLSPNFSSLSSPSSASSGFSSSQSSGKSAEKDLKNWLDVFETSFLRLLNDLVYIHLDFTPSTQSKKVPSVKGEERHEEKEGVSLETPLSHTTSLREIEDGYSLFLHALLHKLRSDLDTILIPSLLSYSPSPSSVSSPFVSSSSSCSFSLSLFSLSLLSAALSPCAAVWSCRGRALELLLLPTPPPSQDTYEKMKEGHTFSSSSFSRQAKEGQSSSSSLKSSSSSYLSSQGTVTENGEKVGAPRAKNAEEEEKGKDMHFLENSPSMGGHFLVSSPSDIYHDFSSHITSFSSFLQAFLSRRKHSSSIEDRAKRESLDQELPLSSSSLVTNSSSSSFSPLSGGVDTQTASRHQQLARTTPDATPHLLSSSSSSCSIRKSCETSSVSLEDLAKELYREISAGCLSCFTIVSFEALRDSYVDFHRALDSLVFDNDGCGFWPIEDEATRGLFRTGKDRRKKKQKNTLQMKKILLQAASQEVEVGNQRHSEKEQDERKAKKQEGRRLCLSMIPQEVSGVTMEFLMHFNQTARRLLDHLGVYANASSSSTSSSSSSSSASSSIFLYVVKSIAGMQLSCSVDEILRLARARLEELERKRKSQGHQEKVSLSSSSPQTYERSSVSSSSLMEKVAVLKGMSQLLFDLYLFSSLLDHPVPPSFALRLIFGEAEGGAEKKKSEGNQETSGMMKFPLGSRLSLYTRKQEEKDKQRRRTKEEEEGDPDEEKESALMLNETSDDEEEKRQESVVYVHAECVWKNLCEGLNSNEVLKKSINKLSHFISEAYKGADSQEVHDSLAQLHHTTPQVAAEATPLIVECIRRRSSLFLSSCSLLFSPLLPSFSIRPPSIPTTGISTADDEDEEEAVFEPPPLQLLPPRERFQYLPVPSLQSSSSAEPSLSKPPSGTASRMTSLDEHSRQGSTPPSVSAGDTEIPKETFEEGVSFKTVSKNFQTWLAGPSGSGPGSSGPQLSMATSSSFDPRKNNQSPPSSSSGGNPFTSTSSLLWTTSFSGGGGNTGSSSGTGGGMVPVAESVGGVNVDNTLAKLGQVGSFFGRHMEQVQNRVTEAVRKGIARIDEGQSTSQSSDRD